MKSFDEWYETIDDCAFDDMICAMGSAFEAGQQSKQDEVDVLRKRINDAIKTMEQNKPLMMYHHHAVQALAILKGESNES